MDKKNQGTSNTAKSILKKKREMEGMRWSDFKAVVTVMRLWSPQTHRRIVKGTEQRTWEETHQSAPNLFPTQEPKRFKRTVSLCNKRCWSNEWLDTQSELDWKYTFCTKLTSNEWQPISVFLPGESPRTEEPGGLWSMGSQRAGRDRETRSTAAQTHRGFTSKMWAIKLSGKRR